MNGAYDFTVLYGSVVHGADEGDSIRGLSYLHTRPARVAFSWHSPLYVEAVTILGVLQDVSLVDLFAIHVVEARELTQGVVLTEYTS